MPKRHLKGNDPVRIRSLEWNELVEAHSIHYFLLAFGGIRIQPRQKQIDHSGVASIVFANRRRWSSGGRMRLDQHSLRVNYIQNEAWWSGLMPVARERKQSPNHSPNHREWRGLGRRWERCRQMEGGPAIQLPGRGQAMNFFAIEIETANASDGRVTVTPPLRTVQFPQPDGWGFPGTSLDWMACKPGRRFRTG